jgi:hypothetical protein
MTTGETRSAVTAAAGAAVTAAGLVVAPHTMALSYLVAYAWIVSIVVGMLLLVMIEHLSGAEWFVVMRRDAETVLGSMPVLAVYAIPLVAAPGLFWPWAARFDALSPSMREDLAPKLWYLNSVFFAVRTAIYWSCWIWIAERLRRMSQRQDVDRAAVPSERLRTLSAAGIVPTTLALTFAAFDWMMSLSPGWSSSIYGAYYSAGALLAALALAGVLARRAQAVQRAAAPTAEHVHALARLTLAFVLLWAYFWYSQLFIAWIADIPREAGWYVVRLSGGWRVIERGVLVCGFAVPFLVLVFRAARRSGKIVGALGVLLLIVHYFDVFWLVAPSGEPRWSIGAFLLGVGPVALLTGSAAAMAIRRARGIPDVPIGDPLLHWSNNYQTE